eukprot:CAMPEP_0170492004 /NCGR_PEP_ID=MMETSP0208-20121228/11515_1 /TAXON_ID=197538 /ORGANISM="Strombidium inclinatum, Strain S3" /LENGTH=74 /DNA_ID=CAMNT_0010767683 /DNA_START=34 /DNA_END=258 /DNA_ORIENTATION=-
MALIMSTVWGWTNTYPTALIHGFNAQCSNQLRHVTSHLKSDGPGVNATCLEISEEKPTPATYLISMEAQAKKYC